MPDSCLARDEHTSLLIKNTITSNVSKKVNRCLWQNDIRFNFLYCFYDLCCWGLLLLAMMATAGMPVFPIRKIC